MHYINFLLLAPVLTFLFFFSFTGALIYRYRTKPSAIKYGIILGMIFQVIWVFFTILLRIAPDKETGEVYLRISVVAVVLAHYFLSQSHIDLLPRADMKYITLYRIQNVTAVATISLAIFNPVSLSAEKLNGYFVDEFDSVLSIIFMIESVVTISIITLALVNYDLHKDFYSFLISSRLMYLIFIGSISIMLAVIIWFVLSISGSHPNANFVVFSTIFPNSLLFYIYGINKMDLRVFSQRIYAYFVINKAGLLTYEHYFNEADQETNNILVANAISATLTIFSEELHTAELELIKFSDRALVVKGLDGYTHILITDYITNYVISLLDIWIEQLSQFDLLPKSQKLVIPVKRNIAHLLYGTK